MRETIGVYRSLILKRNGILINANEKVFFFSSF